MIQPGTYKGTILSNAISETQAGLPQSTITFSVVSDGRPHTITWFGSFKEGKAREITIKSLITCGLKGNNPAGDVEIGKEVSLVIDNEVDENGKSRTKVKWINPLGAVRNVIPKSAALAKLSELEGAVMALRQERSSGIISSRNIDDEMPDWMRDA
jgi:hypothetical protein